MTVELVWPGKYDHEGRRSPIPSSPDPVILQPMEVFGTGSEPSHRLLAGDNLASLRALLPELTGRVDLVYVDPPFCTGGTFELLTKVGEGADGGPPPEVEQVAYRDRWSDGGFLGMLDARLRLLHTLLADHGSFYIHVDPTIGHAVKLLVDEVFGSECFQREIVWRIGWISGFKASARNWIRNHDLIFFYTKHPRRFTFNKLYTPYPPGYRRRDGALPTGQGVPLDDVWNANEAEFALRGRDSLDSIQIKSFSTEKSGYGTQKNESLLRRIIAASSNAEDLVLDAFCGSGTTGVAADELGRRFIGCDISQAAIHIATKRILARGGSRGLRIECVHPGPSPSKLVGHPFVDGSRASVRVPFGETVDERRVESIWTDARASGATRLLVVADAYDLDLEWRRPASVQLCCPSSDAVRGCIEVPELSCRVICGKDGTVELAITGYGYPQLEQVPETVRRAIAHWSDWLDAWWVGTDSEPIQVLAQRFRTHRQRALDQTIVLSDGQAHRRLRLRSIDILYCRVDVLIDLDVGDPLRCSAKRLQTLSVRHPTPRRPHDP